MTVGELKRYLKAQGATFVEGTRHTKVQLNGKSTLLPRHTKQEVKTGTYRQIMKDLGLQ